ncbi:MAG: hypothetical protein JWQ38_835 [Flavipsychrobacter sp.]|nr:hypothetical protein [Flavipsychrobacter sp.]
MKYLFCFLLLPFSFLVKGQSYSDSILKFREQYTAELLADKRSPIKPWQAKSLSFYKADRSFCVWADFNETPGSKPFLIQTHSGKQKPYREYGALSFMLNGTKHTLHIYQSMDLVKQEALKDYLFIPFNDETNYETTFAGGRYIDMSIKDIIDNKVLLDFNKCYNPYCAYADGFSCPIPPKENYLHTRIEAGEKMFPQ